MAKAGWFVVGYLLVGVAVWLPCEFVWNRSRVISAPIRKQVADSGIAAMVFIVVIWPIHLFLTITHVRDSRARRPVMSATQRQRQTDRYTQRLNDRSERSCDHP